MRKTVLASLGLMAAITVPALPAAAQQGDFSQVQMKSTQVSGNVYMLEGAGGNIGVSVGNDGILIIDDQFAPLADKIRAALKGLGDGKLRFVLNTHWHGDHTGGNASFGKEATIVAHDNVRKRLGAEQTVRGEKVPASPAEALPVITFGDSVSIHFNGEEIKALHIPHAHTDGDSAIYFTRNKVVHLGDTFFVDRFPFVDLESGGSVPGLIAGIEKVIAETPADYKIIPGHGPLSTLDDLKRYHRMLVETTGIVRKKIEAGKTVEEIRAEGLPEQWKSWGGGFINQDAWITFIHQSYTQKPAAHSHGDGKHH